MGKHILLSFCRRHTKEGKKYSDTVSIHSLCEREKKITSHVRFPNSRPNSSQNRSHLRLPSRRSRSLRRPQPPKNHQRRKTPKTRSRIPGRNVQNRQQVP